MTAKQIEKLMLAMRQNGASYLKTLEIELKLDPSVEAPIVAAPAMSEPPRSEPKPEPRSEPKPEPALKSSDRGPEHAGAAPPKEVEIPHHLNEVNRLLKLNDEDLVDALFPLPKGIEE